MKSQIKSLTHLFVQRGQWKDFFDTYGVEFNREEQIRFYWWLAFGEISIAYWAATAGFEDKVSVKA